MGLEKDYAMFNAILKPHIGEDLELQKFYSSPLPGRGDSKPSFQVYPGENHESNDTKVDFSQMLFWKDWGYGNHIGHRPIDLIRHLSEDEKGNMCSIDEAKKRLKLMDFPSEGIRIKIMQKKEIEHVSSLELSNREINFWQKRYVQPPLLNRFRVAGTRELYTDGQKSYDHTNSNVMFTYLGPDDEFQLYRPKPKWYSRSLGGHFILGYEQLPPRGRVLLLESGMKDGLCSVVATAWSFLATCGENDYKSYLPILPELKKRFDYIGICQDPDPAGVQANLLLQDKLDLPIFDFPYPNDEWDIDDLMVRFGPQRLREGFFYKRPFV